MFGGKEMLKLFQYNWQVREDWFNWCKQVPEEELLKRRIGGPGSLLYTLFHIIDVEYSWICGLEGKPEPDEPPFDQFASLQRVRDLSSEYHQTVRPFVLNWKNEMETQILTDDENKIKFKYGEIMRHVIAHEIHHIGQISVWAREMGHKPITANLNRRGLFD